MLIRIRIDDRGTPSGVFTLEAGSDRSFSGWLDLLALLAETLESPGNDEPSR